ncbi:MAG TPA: Mur ligase domain-containing protein, partial [Chryseolinea sp.]|nr:Mur ligase domain-containing protein [Chryseolinea sp.]
MIYFSHLATITGGKNLLFKQDYPIETLSIDSRKISSDKGILFLAIKGDRHDGHDYLNDLYHKGIHQFIVEDPAVNTSDFPNANILLVSSTVEALQKLAEFHRKKFS